MVGTRRALEGRPAPAGLDGLAARRPRIDVVHLLPSFARARLFTFPDPAGPAWDCSSTALDFFEPDPDARVLSPAEVARALTTRYDPVPGDRLELGDILVYRRGDTLVHAAVYLADDLLFTKNGSTSLAPWLLMRADDVRDQYATDGNVVVDRWRPRIPR